MDGDASLELQPDDEILIFLEQRQQPLCYSILHSDTSLTSVCREFVHNLLGTTSRVSIENSLFPLFLRFLARSPLLPSAGKRKCVDNCFFG